ncbi:MAG: hypothetical protein NVV66_18315 [Cellulomonas sp.]|uniref:hypothetical protein n=1 Tax=Cellulomonas sp. TaxID=40001 RepID=UPI0025898F1F|nr:hypothetical protein [Cellulomonas sp.]MCR6706552.1 hypothetical protein [Cellulomonas sp.]
MTLREALLALLPGAYEGEAPATASPPWKVVTLDVPTPSSRALAGCVLTHRVRVRVTVAAANAHACTLLADQVRAIEGARIAPAGWVCSPVRHVNSRPVVARNPQVTFPATNTAAFYAVLEFELTASERPVTP